MGVLVYPDPQELAREAAVRIVGALASRGETRLTLGLAGGETPRATYAELARATFDWRRVDLWLSDERWVPPQDDRSNGAMVESLLASRVDAPLHRPDFDAGRGPHWSAAAYEETLRRVFAGRRPDVVVLGMGADGHTASLFPGTPALEVRDRWYVANQIPETGEWRLTATFPLLLAAERIFVLVTGVAKASTLRAVLEGPPDVLPCQRLLAAGDRLEWLVDADAAAELRSLRPDRPV